MALTTQTFLTTNSPGPVRRIRIPTAKGELPTYLGKKLTSWQKHVRVSLLEA